MVNKWFKANTSVYKWPMRWSKELRMHEASRRVFSSTMTRLRALIQTLSSTAVLNQSFAVKQARKGHVSRPDARRSNVSLNCLSSHGSREAATERSAWSARETRRTSQRTSMQAATPFLSDWLRIGGAEDYRSFSRSGHRVIKIFENVELWVPSGMKWFREEHCYVTRVFIALRLNKFAREFWMVWMVACDAFDVLHAEIQEPSLHSSAVDSQRYAVTNAMHRATVVEKLVDAERNVWVATGCCWKLQHIGTNPTVWGDCRTYHRQVIIRWLIDVLRRKDV